jgi:hypothetical protein
LLGLSVLSVIYAVVAPDQIPFDHTAWITASSEAGYAQRNRMINDVQHRIDNGELNTDDLIREKLGNPDTVDQQSGAWYYRLGSPGGSTSNRMLELAFEKNGRVLSRRVVAD